MTVVLLALAGAAGVLARHTLTSAVDPAAASWATLAINVAGSALLGALVAWPGASTELRTVAGVGFLGGFTTFSTFAVVLLTHLQEGEPGRAAAYAFVSVLAGLAAAAAGYAVVRAAL